MNCKRIPSVAAGLAWLLAAVLARGAAAGVPSPVGDPLPATGLLAEAAQSVRDPFWPVGWRPPPPVPEGQEEPEERFDPRDVAWPALRLRGVSRRADGRALAVLEGIGLVEVGDVISLVREGLMFRWRIDRIDSRGIAPVRLEVRPVENTPPGGAANRRQGE